ncbi:hypothetical protein R3P38DRAFT_948474 [Favolaschia claudopus]|uniref:Secreted protein n=1 Tax=Favolaschia claudopus TaxID=2862362 RepID=A0AAW0BMB1_9AGAR
MHHRRVLSRISVCIRFLVSFYSLLPIPAPAHMHIVMPLPSRPRHPASKGHRMEHTRRHKRSRSRSHLATTTTHSPSALRASLTLLPLIPVSRFHSSCSSHSPRPFASIASPNPPPPPVSSVRRSFARSFKAGLLTPLTHPSLKHPLSCRS